MAGLVGKLKVSLGLDGTAFTKGLKEQRTGMQKFGAGLAKVGAGISVASAGIALALRSQLNAADDLSKAAQKFGIPIETLGALAHAGDMSGVSMETLGTGVRKLSQNMDDAMKGNKTAIALFKDIGISVKDAAGEMRSSEDVMADVADVLAGMPDGAAKTALAMKLLGKSGAEMIPMLNGGSAALNSMIAEARSLGLVIDAQTGKAAEDFNDNLSRLSKTMSGIAVQVMANLAPSLRFVSNLAVEATKVFRDLSPGVQTAMSVIAGLVVVLGPLAVGLGLTTMAVSSLATAFAFLWGPIGLAIAAITAVAAAAVLVYVNFDKLKAVALEVWQRIADGATVIDLRIQEVSQRIKGSFLGAVASMQAGWANFLRSLGSGADAVPGLGAIADGLKEAAIMAQSSVYELEGASAAAGEYAANWAGQADVLASSLTRPLESMKNLNEGIAAGVASVTDSFAGAIEGANGLGDAVSGAGAKGGTAIDSLKKKTDDLKESASPVKSAFEAAFVGATTGSQTLREAITGLISQFAQMAATQAFQSLWSSFSGGGSGGSGILGGIGKIFGFANGTQNAPGGLSWVGERGPELVNLPRGSQVFDSQRSASIMNGGGESAVRVIGGDLTLSDSGAIMTQVKVIAERSTKAGLSQVPSMLADQNKRRH